MLEATNGLSQGESVLKDFASKLGPRDFVLKNLKYIPWIIISGAIAFVLAYLKIRYTTPIFLVQSSMVINNSSSGIRGDRFDAMMMAPGTENLSNETRILSSRPVLQRVVRNIHIKTRYYNIGKVRTSLLYPVSPFTLEMISNGESPDENFRLQITIINDQQFKIGKETRTHEFGEILNMAGKKFTLIRDPNVDLKNFASPVFYFSNQSVASVASEYLGAVKIVQTNEQSSILDLSFTSENTELGRNFLNALMEVYDSLNIENKNRISINSLLFINKNLDTLVTQLGMLEGKVKNFRVENDMFDAEDQSKLYLNNAESGQTSIDAMDVKITVANLLQQYINSPEKKHELVPINMGIEEPALGFQDQRIQ